MPKMTPALWAKLTVALTTLAGGFAAGAFTWLQTYFATPHATIDWKAVAIGAAGAGVSAAWHRWQPSPAQVPASPTSKPGATLGAIIVLLSLTGGCAAFWAALSKVETGLPVLVTAIEGTAQAEADYAAAHPDDPAVKVAAEKLKGAEDAAKALTDGVKAVKAAGSGDVSSLVAAAIAAYSDAKAAVDGLGARVGEARIESKLVPVSDVSVALGAS